MIFEFKKGMQVKVAIKCEEGKYNYGFHCGLAKRADKNVFINKKGEIILDCTKYDQIGEFWEDKAYVKDATGKYGYIDIKGEKIIDCRFDKAEMEKLSNHFNFVDDRALVSLNGKPCYINEKGEVVIENFSYSRGFYEEMAYTIIDDKPYFINKSGEKIIDCSKYDDVGNFSCGLAGVAKDDKYGYIDKTGKEVISLIYDREKGLGMLEDFINGVVMVQKNDKYGFIDTNGNEIIECKYNKTGAFNCAGVELNGKRYFINRDKKILVPCDIAYVGTFSEGLSRVDNKTGGWGYIDLEGNLVVPYNYTKVWDFSEGMGLVYKRDEKTGAMLSGYLTYLM